jgi:hypothetical protein
MRKFNFSFCFITFILTIISCHKIEPTKTTITAVNETKVPIANVKVVIRAQPSQVVSAKGNLSDSAYTNAKGQVEFDYSSIYQDGQAGVAVLDITGVIITGNDTLEGASYVQLDAGITKPATVILRKKKK